jgi:hypothetical protein
MARFLDAPSTDAIERGSEWENLHMTVVAEPGPVESIAGALADDGSAVVVFQTATDLFAIDRGPGGA